VRTSASRCYDFKDENAADEDDALYTTRPSGEILSPNPPHQEINRLTPEHLFVNVDSEQSADI